jgi:hypothetical protein
MNPRVLCLRDILLYFIFFYFFISFFERKKRSHYRHGGSYTLGWFLQGSGTPCSYRVHGLQRASLGTPQKPTTLTRTSPTITYLVLKGYREANNIHGK